MSNRDALLARLGKLRQIREDEWTALCPAHADRTPSLAVKQLTGGKILVYCHAGCSAREIVESIGLEMTDLFPDREDKAIVERRLRIRAQETEDILRVELARACLMNGMRLSEKEAAAVRAAAGRLRKAVAG